MENKHYIPEIEEFRVGFRFEQYDPDIPADNQPYKKQTCSKKSLIEIFQAWKYYSDYRVKYLDKKDIEELGWVQDKTHKHLFRLKEFTINFNDENGFCIIDSGEKVYLICFMGVIKNYNGLKKVMEMLNIKKDG